MKAMILAAGRGERMRPLTDHTPKPMLEAGGDSLIGHHLTRLRAAGITDIVINHAWLGEVIEKGLGDGSSRGVRIQYSAEGKALETAGGIAKALPLLGDEAFLVINGDVWCDWDIARARTLARRMKEEGLIGWCVLVPNPPQHPNGDFGLKDERLVSAAPDQGGVRQGDVQRYTYAGIALFEPAMFSEVPAGAASPLRPWLDKAIAGRRLGGELHQGRWSDVGTPDRLAALIDELKARPAGRTQTSD